MILDLSKPIFNLESILGIKTTTGLVGVLIIVLRWQTKNLKSHHLLYSIQQQEIYTLPTLVTGDSGQKKNGIQPPTVTATLQDASKLSLQNYEFSLPFSYTVKNFTIGITPYYSIPANPAVVTIKIKPVIGPTQTKVITEKTENIFYFSLDAAIKF